MIQKAFLFSLFLGSLSAQVVPGTFLARAEEDSTLPGLQSNVVVEIRAQGDSLIWLGTGKGLSVQKDSLDNRNSARTFQTSKNITAGETGQVSFPGDKNRKRKVRVRGIKKASKEIQQRLDKNLETLLEDPESFLPEFRCELGKPRRDMVAMTLRDVDYVSQKRHDRRWLSKRMVKRRGDIVCRALAGSLLAAGEEDTSTVSVYNSPIYGASSFIRRGNGKQSHMVGIQNFTHPKLRLLVWDDHAKAGNWFFSWDGGFVCTGTEAKVPDEWLESSLDNASVTFNGEDIRWSKGLEKEIVENEKITDSGWLKLDFGDVVVGLCSSSLSKTNDAPFVPSIALGMICFGLTGLEMSKKILKMKKI